MKFVTDPLTLAVALGMLGPAALGDRDMDEDNRSGDVRDLVEPLSELVREAGPSAMSELVQEWEMPAPELASRSPEVI